MAQTSRSFNGGFWPISLPRFHGLKDLGLVVSGLDAKMDVMRIAPGSIPSTRCGWGTAKAAELARAAVSRDQLEADRKMAMNGQYRAEQHRTSVPGIEALALVSDRSFPRHAHDGFGVGVLHAGAHRSWSGVGHVEATAGDVITVTALVPAAEGFAAGRDFAAWLGLTPLQKSTGGKQKLGAISKRGERTIRRLLILGASAVIRQACIRGAPAGSWLGQMLPRKPKMLVTVALANKTARIVWALLVKGGEYRAPIPAV